MDTTASRQYKRKAFEDLLQIGRIYVTINTRIKGVRIPSEHQGKSALTIVFGLDMPTPLKDMEVTEDGIEVTLSFERQPHHCCIPWDSVWYMVPVGEQEGLLFEQSLPASVRVQLEERGDVIVPTDLDSYLATRCCKKEDERRQRFKVIDGGDYETTPDSSLTNEYDFDVEGTTPICPPPLHIVETDED